MSIAKTNFKLKLLTVSSLVIVSSLILLFISLLFYYSYFQERFSFWHIISLYSWVIGLFFTVVTISVLFLRYYASQIDYVIVGLTDVCKKISIGDFSQRLSVESEDELSIVTKSYNSIHGLTEEIGRIKEQIKNGKFRHQLVLQSDKDSLRLALNELFKANEKVIDKLSIQDWIRTGLNELNNILRGDLSMADLCNRSIGFLTEYCDGSVGALYLSTETKTLNLFATFAFTKRKHLLQNLQFGETLVGQAALEKKTIILEDVPDHASSVLSSSVEIRPKHLVISPLLFQHELIGVIEVGFINPLPEKLLYFIEEACNQIAMSIQTAIASEKVQKLLDESQVQAKILADQQVALQNNNEELNYRSQLMETQSRELYQQREELSQVNSELEQRTEALEIQQKQINEKNSELQALTIELERKALELETASKYKSEFLANMSHELRTPLNSLLILSRLLAENKEKNLTNKQTEYAGTIFKAGNDLLTLINDILDLSKIEAGHLEFVFEDVKIQEIQTNIRNIFSPLAKDKGLDFKSTLSPEVPELINSDIQRLEQILRNLLSNAMKFTSKGFVALNISLVDGENSPLKKPSICFAINDTGTGIPNDKLNLIFEAFKQVDGTISRKYGGTGLGLSISRQLASKLGGLITVTSELGTGSTFNLYLPYDKTIKTQQSTVTSASIENKKAVSNNFIEDDRNSINDEDSILLAIEDDLTFAKILYESGKKKGFKCICTNYGEEGIELAKKFKVSGIILDFQLPDMTGDKILERLKEDPLTRHIPVHLISADDSKRSLFSKGTIGFLNKPISSEKIESVLSRIQELTSGNIKNLLIVEDDHIQSDSLVELFKTCGTESTAAYSGSEALQILTTRSFDAIVLDLGLGDMSGIEFLEKFRASKTEYHIPVIIHTGRSLTLEEQKKLQKLSNSIVLKGSKSHDRLLDEIKLFLHLMNKNSQTSTKPTENILPDTDNDILENKTIMIVDDDVRNIFSLTKLIESYKANVVSAENGQEALHQLPLHAIDLILMDIMMPLMDGIAATKQIRTIPVYKNLPIIALTAKVMKGDREACIEAGASDYLTKPVNADKLIGNIKLWLKKTKQE